MSSAAPFSSAAPIASANGTASASASASEIWPVVGRVSLTVLATVGSLLATALYYIGLYLGYAAVWLVNTLAAWPISRIYNASMFLLSPIFYTLSYTFAPAIEFYHFLGQFRPLYTYLGSAAFIGVITGLAIKVGASYFFVILHISHEDEKNDSKFQSTTFRRLHYAAHHSGKMPAYPSDSRPRIAGKDTSKDDVWQWLEEFKPKKPSLGGSAAAVGDQKSNVASLSNQSLQATPILEESSTE